MAKYFTPAGGGRMTGSAQTQSEAVRFIMLLGEKKKERVWERKGLRVGPDRRLADDGKRLHRRWTLYPDRLFLFKNRVGGLGEGGRPIAPGTRLADDGKRPYRRWTLFNVHFK